MPDKARGRPLRAGGDRARSFARSLPSQLNLSTKDKAMAAIRRIEAGPRMSQAVIHGSTVYLAGQVGEPGGSVAQQTKDILAEIERLLKEAGSDKSKILQAIIWMADMKDFAEMNAVWDKWVVGKDAPARATGEAKLAAPEYKVEIIVTAAV